MTSLYHLRSASGGYRITKLTDDYEVESSYIVSASECTCPAGAKPTCRHRQMLPFFLAKGHVNNGWMLDWHTRQWRKPLCEDGRATPIEPTHEMLVAQFETEGKGATFIDEEPPDPILELQAEQAANLLVKEASQTNPELDNALNVILGDLESEAQPPPPAASLGEEADLLHPLPPSPEAPTRAEVEPHPAPSGTTRVGASTFAGIKRRRV